MRKYNEFDVHLLRILCTLVTEKSVTRSALTLDISQPAISLALAKLRRIFSDRLLVRGRDGMVPTERALTILPRAQRLLMELEGLAADTMPFDPKSSTQTFTIASPDYMAPVFLHDVVTAFRREAPHASLSIRGLNLDFDYEVALARGEIDIVIGNWPAPPNYLHRSVLLRDDIVCVMSASHPLAQGKLTKRAYLAAEHVVPGPYAAANRGVIGTQLLKMRVERKRTVVSSSFITAFYLLPDSDLIFTASHHFADYFARVLPLAIRTSPVSFPPMTFYQLWHDRTHHSPMHRWLRGLLGLAGRDLAQMPKRARLK